MQQPLASPAAARWIDDPVHRDWLAADARRAFAFFRASIDGGIRVLDHAGRPLPDTGLELHTTTRLVHSYALGKAWGIAGCEDVIDACMTALRESHRDPLHGGYLWKVGAQEDPTKLAYGHVFVLLAASSAKQVGHPGADTLLADIAQVLEERFWDEAAGRLRDEFTRDWQPFSDYRGMNANMHGVEAMLGAYEATGERLWLERAGRILSFFVSEMARANGWRIPEHYRGDWTPDHAYAGNPMFRPRGTTPGHSFEFARLHLQHWDLAGRRGDAPDEARALVATAMQAWQPGGGFAYTLDRAGRVDVPNRYWWPVTEAIGATAALLKLGDPLEAEYRRLWQAARALFVDEARGGWYPEVDAEGRPDATQFDGKPDIYHAVQADLIPLAPGLSRIFDGLGQVALRG